MIRRYIFAIAVIGLLANLATDLQVYNQSRVTGETGAWVNHTYDVLRALDRTRINILADEKLTGPPPGWDRDLARLTALTRDSQAESEKILQMASLSWQDDVVASRTHALQILSAMKSVEENLLEQRLESDRKSNTTAGQRIFMANSVDILMLCLVAGFFWYERRRNDRKELALTGTIRHLEKINESMKKTLASRGHQFQVTMHDLKNPLGSIRGFAELIHEEANSDAVIEMSKIIGEVADRMLDLVGTLQQKPQEVTEDKDKKNETFNLCECLAEVCRFLEPVAAKKNQRIMFEADSDPLWFTAERSTLQDVFFNLIGNAIKFSSVKAEIKVSCHGKESRIEVLVADQGPGFHSEDFSRLFQPGASLSARPTGGESSTGMGLYSAQQTIRSYRGDIEVSNRPEGGACIKVLLPSSSA